MSITPLEIAMAIGANSRYTLDILNNTPYSFAIVDNDVDSSLRFVLSESSPNYYGIQSVYKHDGNTIYEFGYGYRGGTSYIPDINKFVSWIEKEAQDKSKICSEALKVFNATAAAAKSQSINSKQLNCREMIDAYPERTFLARMYLDSWRKDNPQQMFCYANGQFNLIDISVNTKAPTFVKYSDGRRFKTYDAAKSQIIKSVYADTLK